MRTIEVSEETYEKIKGDLDVTETFDVSDYSDFIGKSFYFRTITYHLIGKVKKIVGSFLFLESASWIADSGRFENCIKKGELNEVEPVGTAFINLNSCTDIFPWKHELPTKQK